MKVGTRLQDRAVQPAPFSPQDRCNWAGGVDHWKERQRANGLVKVVYQIHLMGAYTCGFCKWCLETTLEAWIPQLAKLFFFLVLGGGVSSSHSYTVQGCWLFAAQEELPTGRGWFHSLPSANHTQPSLEAQEWRRFLEMAVVLFLSPTA